MSRVLPLRVWAEVIALTLFIVAFRLLPHPPNFAPVAAGALFAGFYFKSRINSLFVPVAAMGLSDLAIGAYDWRIMAAVYIGLAFPVLLSPIVRKLSTRRVIMGSAASSLVFFTLSNAAVWAFSPLYSTNLDGLTRCYVAALPFFAYTIAGDLFWSGIFFGAYALATSEYGKRTRLQLEQRLRRRPEVSA